MKPMTSLSRKSLQERAYEAVEAALGKNSPEGRYVLGIIGTKARHARKRAEVKVRRSLRPNAIQSQEWEDMRDKADKAFSDFIRRRDTKQYGDVRMGHCVTCNGYKEYALLQCGHWIKRGHFGTRWSEWNCHAQCGGCNDPHRGAGREPEHETAIKRLHGQEMPDRLRVEKKLKAKKPSKEHLAAIIKQFRERTEALP